MTTRQRLRAILVSLAAAIGLALLLLRCASDPGAPGEGAASEPFRSAQYETKE